MPGASKYLDFLADWLAPLGQITSRPMFGGYCLYCNGVVFALVADSVLYLKVDDTTRPQFEALGLQPFRPFEDRPEGMLYYPPPPEFFEDSEAMRGWGSAAAEVGRRAAARQKARKQNAKKLSKTASAKARRPAKSRK